MNIDYTLWPNPDGELGVNKVTIPTGIGDDTWPEGDALINNVVYKDGKISGFVDTKALTVNESKSTTFPYDCVNIQVDKSLEGVMTFNKGERTKYFTITYTGSSNSGETFDFVIIDFNTTDAETIDTVRTAKRVVDNKLYDANGGLIGTIDTSKIEVGGIIYDEQALTGDGLFCYVDVLAGEVRDIVLSEFDSDLSSLRDGGCMFSGCTNLTSFTSDLSSLMSGSYMFYGCTNLVLSISDLSNLVNGGFMFTGCTNLTSFNSDLSSLRDGEIMFAACTNLASFTSDLPSLTSGDTMFGYCSNLTSFSSDLSSLTRGSWMFSDCSNLTSFNSNLSSLTNGSGMFENCKLDTTSIQNIADTIKNISSLTGGSSSDDEVFKYIDIGIGNSTPNEDEIAAFDTIASKGWTVYVNGSNYTPSTTASIMTLDENGEEVSTPIPYYAKPVPATEKTASYVDANGNFFNIAGAQFIYGDDLSTYGMFTCEEDAAFNMGLTKIEKPVEKLNKLIIN